MIDSSFKNFVYDLNLRSIDNRDMLYFFLEKNNQLEKSFIDDNHNFTKELFENILDYLFNNVTFFECNKDIRPKSINYHERFGWVINWNNCKSYLGKSSINGKVKIQMGRSSYISGSSNINGNKNLKIGSFTSIAQGVEFFTSNINHPINHVSTFNLDSNSRLLEEGRNIGLPNFRNQIEKLESKHSIDIGNDVWIGRDVLIMPGVKIPNGCVIGAKSLITKNLEPYGVYVGSPAKLIKFRFSEKIVIQLNEIKWWNWSSIDIKKNKDFFDIDLTKDTGNLEQYLKL
mgnify:CR=1 FL=1|jgi:acetyltransferase-like isoleucine patch superfamily enzyme